MEPMRPGRAVSVDRREHPGGDRLRDELHPPADQRRRRDDRPADGHHAARQGRRRDRDSSTRRRSSAPWPSCASTGRRWTSRAWSGCGSPPPARRGTPATARTSSARPRQIVGTRPELLSGEEEGRLSFAGATADLDPSRRPVPGDRHRRRVHRVHGRHRAARGRPQLRRRVRAPHREAPGERPAGARGAQQRHRRGAGVVRRPAARGAGVDAGARPSSGWPAPSPRSARSRSGWPTTTAT